MIIYAAYKMNIHEFKFINDKVYRQSIALSSFYTFSRFEISTTRFILQMEIYKPHFFTIHT